MHMLRELIATPSVSSVNADMDMGNRPVIDLLASWASDLGFEVTVVADATAAHEHEGHDGIRYSAEEIHNVNLASLNGEFCKVRSTAEILRDVAAAD